MDTEGTILVIDDDEPTRALLRRLLAPRGYVLRLASTLEEGLAAVADSPPDLILLDIKMPDGDGRQACRRLRAHPDTADLPIILMTAHPESGRLWLFVGADAILYKPLRHDELLSWVRAFVGARRARAKLDRIETMLVSLAASIEARSEHRREHLSRVAWYSQQLAQAMGVDPEEIPIIRRAALLHDIGMIAVSDAVLHQPRSLTPAEFAQVKQHPVVGAELCQSLPDGEKVAALIRHHHERWHGGGYPDGLSGKDIPIGARIIAVADAFDTLTSDRPYRSALTADGALDVLVMGAGAQWDPDVVEKLAEIVRRGARDGAAPAQPIEGPAPDAAAGPSSYHHLEAFIKYLQLTGDRP
ncbi:MAG: response regulator [Armatimonadota bacterium]|nr:response regulator [Armatimonadota bacterium]